MSGINFNKRKESPRVLISPLDWGLGHATRCIPIIYQLISLNCEVLVAADKESYSLLKKEFPSTVFLRLKGYEIKYSRHKRTFPLTLLLQLPKIYFAIRNENKWLKKIVKQYKIDAVVSDNRLGLYCTDIPGIYITHQLLIKTGNQFTEKIAQALHRHFINKYSECWVPDLEVGGLAGALSHPKKLPANTTYIGPLSRFEKMPGVEKVYDLLISLSGPEPQRTIFENILLSQLATYSGKVLMVRGLPDEKNDLKTTNDSLKIVAHLSAKELNLALEQSKMVISRSGYTTVMDLVKLNKPGILVPTPGQTEQEYLAKYLSENKHFYTANQDHFQLSEVLDQVKNYSFTPFDVDLESYKEIINQFVLSLKTGNFAPQ